MSVTYQRFQYCTHGTKQDTPFASIQSEEDGLNIGDSPSREYKFGG